MITVGATVGMSGIGRGVGTSEGRLNAARNCCDSTMSCSCMSSGREATSNVDPSMDLFDVGGLGLKANYYSFLYPCISFLLLEVRWMS